MTPISQLDLSRPVASPPRPMPGARERIETLLINAWHACLWVARRIKVQQARKNLRICESVSLGEKRFVAVVQVDEERFLIGGASGSVSLLTRLQESKTFAAVLDQQAGNRS